MHVLASADEVNESDVVEEPILGEEYRPDGGADQEGPSRERVKEREPSSSHRVVQLQHRSLI